MVVTRKVDVSVIVCHHKGDQFVPNLVNSLKKTVGVTYEVICVTSTDMKFDGVRTIYFNGGPAEKRNVGARFAQGRYFVFLDDDTEVESHFLFEIKKALDQPGCGMAYGKTLNMERRKILDNAGSFLTWTGFLWAREESGQVEDKGQFDEPEYIFAGKGAAMALRRSTFERVSGFDPIYEILAEETDISWKVWFVGEKVVWVPTAVLYHAFNTKFKPWNYYYTNKRVYYNGCRNYIIMLLKFLEWKHVALILPFHFLVWFLAGLGMLTTGKFKAGLMIWKGLLYHLNPANIVDTMKRRKKAQRLRTASDKELFKVTMRQPRFSFYWKRFFHYVQTGRHG